MSLKIRVSEIRELIGQAIGDESKSNDLRNQLDSLLPDLHHAITLPKEQALDTLFLFIVRYVKNVPDFLDALGSMMEETGIYKSGEPLITIIEDFFLSSPRKTQERDGLQALIDDAYLAHRLLEEVNDRLIMLYGMPLSPMDMTLSNLIVHEILGDEFANQLDLAVHYAVEALFDNSSTIRKMKEFIHQVKNSSVKWPCLAEESAIALTLTGQA